MNKTDCKKKSALGGWINRSKAKDRQGSDRDEGQGRGQQIGKGGGQERQGKGVIVEDEIRAGRYG